MKAIHYEMIASQIIFWGLATLSLNIAWRFFKSVDGRLRVLMIRLFAAQCWVYTIAGSYYLCWDLGLVDLNSVALRITCNFPLFIVMLQIRRYIVFKK